MKEYKGNYATPASTWQDMLRDFLIEGGTDGWRQRDIITRMEHCADAEMLKNELEFLLNCDPPKVQKFYVPTKGRPKTIWRATIHILKG